MSITKGEDWGRPEHGAPDVRVSGDDEDLAYALSGTPMGVLVSFTPAPESDLAKAVGLQAGAPVQGRALPMDVLELGDGTIVVNAVVLGVAPDRLRWRHRTTKITFHVDGRETGLSVNRSTTLVLATGQWLRGLDLVPRGHPGDGQMEIQTYWLQKQERKNMRERLLTGTHLPHPHITARTGTDIDVIANRELHLEVDGRSKGKAATLRAKVVPARYRLLV